MKTKNTSKLIVVVCLIVILLTGLFTNAVKSNNGNVVIKEVTLSPYGVNLAASMYMPKKALETDEAGNFLNKYPAVIVNAGATNSRTWLDSVSIELAKNGYVVAALDTYGHGRSEYTIHRGFGVTPNLFAGDMSLMGAQDMLEYLRDLGFVDQTRIGMCGHSQGGVATSRMVSKSAGFFTLEDKLINLLYDNYGITITPEQVAQQDADAIANETLTEEQLGEYNILKKQIADEYSIAVRNVVIFDANALGCEPQVVEVGGIPVWRDIQANIAMLTNISGNQAKGLRDRDFMLSSEATLQLMSQGSFADRDQWYKLNLSSDENRIDSTKLLGFYDNPLDQSVQQAAKDYSLRVLTTPFGWHGFTYFSIQTVRDTIEFFGTTFNYYQEQPLTASNVNALTKNPGSDWIPNDIISAIAFFALIFMIPALADIILDLPYFESMKRKPVEPVESKKSPVFWVFMALVILIPFFTYGKGMAWGKNIPASALSTVQLATQIAVWSLVMTAVLLILTIIKYFVYDKKKTELSFFQLYGLDIGAKNLGKSVVLALSIFAFVSVLLTVYFHLFDAASMKLTLAGVVLFRSLTRTEYYSWLLYAIYFLPFYLLNSMLVNAARLKDMSEKSNMWITALINFSGMFVLAFIQIILGLMIKAAPVFKMPPGGSAAIYSLTVLFVMLFVSAIYTRKLYLKTGSSIPGALVNVAIFMIPTIQAHCGFQFW